MRARVARSVGPLVVAASLAGCAVGPEERPHTIPAEDVPYDLLVEDRDQPTATEVARGAAVTVHLVDDDGLVEVAREVAPDATVGDVLALLAAGPTAEERALGWTTWTPEDAVRDVEVVRGVAEVDLGTGLVELTGERRTLAVAQIVFTLTGRPGIGRVRLTVDRSPVQAPRGDGTLTGDALAREDFPGLLRGG